MGVQEGGALDAHAQLGVNVALTTIEGGTGKTKSTQCRCEKKGSLYCPHTSASLHKITQPGFSLILKLKKFSKT